MISRHGGFTIVELMITVALIAILATIAAPSLRDLIKNARMTSLANNLMTDLSIARSEAVKRGVRTTMCTSTNGTSCTTTGGASGWGQGWIIFAESDTTGSFGTVDGNDVILKVAPKIDGASETPPTLVTSVNALSAPTTHVEFRPSGVTTPGGGGGAVVDFYMCDSRTTASVGAAAATDKGRHITISGGGRANANRCTCPTSASCVP
jgi:type IV fimbrial biogenesis protein FimT